MYESLSALDPVKINFNAAGMHTINIILAFVMFGVALGIKPKEFIPLFTKPKALLVGMTSQLIALPLITFLIVIIFYKFIPPMVAMGMILVAACPGGNISNFMSSISRANTELSVGLTAISTSLSVITTPANFAIWGGLYVRYINKHAAHALQPLEIDKWQMFETVFILLGIPLILGILFAHFYPVLPKIRKPIQYLSIVFFLVMVILAFSQNFNLFIKYIFYVFIIVLIHNGLALATGYGIASAFKLGDANRRGITIETGIQNSAGIGAFI